MTKIKTTMFTDYDNKIAKFFSKLCKQEYNGWAVTIFDVRLLSGNIIKISREDRDWAWYKVQD